MLSGVLLGMGTELTFMSLLNYLTDAYGMYSASVLAAAGFSRSLAAVLFPLAGDPLYRALGTAWATSALGFLCLVLGLSPFLLLFYGHKLRARSPFCQSLLEQKRQEESIA